MEVTGLETFACEEWTKILTLRWKKLVSTYKKYFW